MQREHAPGPARRLYALTLRELTRNRFGLVLLLVIPPLFLAAVEGTSSSEALPIKLYSGGAVTWVDTTQRDVSMVFIGAAVSGFLTAYYAILLFQRNLSYFRHCVGMGLSPAGFLGARLAFFLTVVVVLALFVTILLGARTGLENPLGVLLGFALLGAVYGGYGGLVGLLSRDFLVAVLCVVLLANLDAGWLQNPVFYSTAQDADWVRWLPAFHPAQVVFAAAFEGSWNTEALFSSVAYAASFWIAITVALGAKVRPLGNRRRHA
jgi:hypothetical protein